MEKRWFVYPNSNATFPAEHSGFDTREEAMAFAVMFYGFHNKADIRRQAVALPQQVAA